VWWVSENRENPVGWWTSAPEFVINKAIWIFLWIQCLLLAAKLVALVLAVLFQTFYNRRSGILNEPIVSFIHRQNTVVPAEIHDDIFLGPKLFHERTFEPVLLGKIRVVVVLATCLALLFYGFALMTVGALRETVVMPTQTVLAGANDPLWNDPIAPVWSAVVSIDKNSLAPGVDFGSAVNVTPLWDTEYLLPLLKDNQTLPQQCEKASEGTDIFTVYDPQLGTQYITFFCPNAFRSNISLSEWISEDIRVVTPDLLVSIDYDKLGLPLDNRLSVLHTALVSMALTNETHIVLNSTFPYPLISRVHTLASVYLSLRRIYRTIHILSLGVFPAYDNYFMARLDVIGPDPFAVVPPNDNTASVRLFQHYDPSDWVIVQDHREYSIVGIFSSLGGIWTVVNGLFALLFGGSMLIVLGAKPVSVFGLAHRICKTTVATNLLKEFPRLKEETFPTDTNLKGVSAFIKDYIVDFGMLDTPGWVQNNIA